MARVDPRAEPVTNPPAKPDGIVSVDRVKITIETPDIPKSAKAPEIIEAPPPPAETKASVAPKSAITNTDPRYAAIEKLLDANDWKAVGDQLGTLDDVGKLPPNLGLLAAVAHNEATPVGHPESVAIAIRCVAAIFGVPEESPIARVLARRLLRKNPTRLRDRPAPPARISLLIIAVTLLLSAGLGWFLSSGGVHMLQKLIR